MMQQTKKKMVLEHLVVRKMNSAADLKQVHTLQLHVTLLSSSLASLEVRCRVVPSMH